jgi:hypothetical protein
MLGLKLSEVIIRRDKKFSPSLRYIGAYIGSRDSFIRITILYRGLKGVTMRRDKVLSSPPQNYRNQLFNHKSAFLRRGISKYGLGRHKSVKLKISIYARIN